MEKEERWVLINRGVWLVFDPTHSVLAKLSNEEALNVMKNKSSSVKPLH